MERKKAVHPGFEEIARILCEQQESHGFKKDQKAFAEYLAERGLRVDQGTISRWLRAIVEIKSRHLAKLEKIFGIDLVQYLREA